MAERNTGYGRTRSRDPDHRLPAYQVLEKIQSKSPNYRYGKRTEVQPHVHSYKGSSRPVPVSDIRSLNNSKSNEVLEKRQHGILSQRSPFPNHNTNTSSESVSSVFSNQSRRPACSFAHQFYVLNESSYNNNNSWGRNNRSKSLSPGTKLLRYHSTPPRYHEEDDEDDEDDEEPNDVVVWNASKRTSRSNMLCPLTDSEINNMTRDERHQRYKMGQRFVEKAHLQHQSEQHGKLLDLDDDDDDDDDQEEEELLEDSSPPVMENDDSCVSLATTSYTKQIALVTQELESIQQAQNDILSQLGEQMIIVSTENERLKKEIDHVRNQNEGLLKVVHDTTEELDRVKQILKKFGIPQTNIPDKDNKDDHEHKHDKAWCKSEKSPSRKEASDESPVLETPEHHPKQRSRSRDSNTSSASRRSKAESAGSSVGSGHSHHEEHYSRTQEMHDHREFGGSGTITHTKGKERRRRKSSNSADADDSDEDNEGNRHHVTPRHAHPRSRYEDDISSQKSTDSHNSQNSAIRRLQRNHESSEVDKVGGGDVLGKPKLKSRSRSRERRHESDLPGESYKDPFRETEKLKKRSRSRSKDSKDNNKIVGSEKKKGSTTKEKDKEKEKSNGKCFNVCGCCFPGAPYADDSDDELFVTDREIHR